MCTYHYTATNLTQGDRVGFYTEKMQPSIEFVPLLLGEADGAVAYHNLGLPGSVDHSCDTPVTPVANSLDVMSAHRKLENSEGSRKSQ